jgi:hypothetical protein
MVSLLETLIDAPDERRLMAIDRAKFRRHLQRSTAWLTKR